MVLSRNAVTLDIPLCSVVACLHAIGFSLHGRLLIIGFYL